MTYIHSPTHLFDNLSFQEALGVYWNMIDMARSVKGPVPNHDANAVNKDRQSSFSYDYAVQRREEIRKRDGYLVEEFAFGDFIIRKGNSSGEFYLSREKLFPQSWQSHECVAQVSVSDPKSAADVAEAVIGFVMQVELVSIAESALKDAQFFVRVQDVTKIGGYGFDAKSLEQAQQDRREREDSLHTRERGNVITSSTIEGIYGDFAYPAFGMVRFIPTQRVEMNQSRFEEIRTRFAREQAEIRELWGAIASQTRNYQFDDQTRYFGFEGTTYTVSHNPSSADPDSSSIAVGYVGGGSLDLLTALRSGLLKAWVEWVSEPMVAQRKSQRQ